VFIINNCQNITFIRHTGLLIIVWALLPLSNVTIHYLKWGFKTRGVTVYLGNSIFDDSIGGQKPNTFVSRVEGTCKEFSWSRGLGIEHSPIKTRSSQKKLAGVTKQPCDNDSFATNCGALRAPKAITRDK
jgi:hypothetical protein